MISPDTWPVFDGQSRDGVVKILNEHKIPTSEFVLGKTMIFIRNPATVGPLTVTY